MARIALLIISIFASATLVHSRGNLHLGSENGAHLIYHEVHEKYAIPFIKRDDEITVTARTGELIRGILVQDLEGDSESYIKRGGVGMGDVTIRIKSARGHGYRFMIDVYAA